MSTTAPELAIDAAELDIERQRVCAEKHACQAQLAELNAKCAVHLPGSEFKKIQQQRSEIIKLLSEKERELAELNSRRAEIRATLEVKKNLVTPPFVKQIVAIRDQWHAFSMDAKNHQKAREAAWKVSQELRELLRAYFANVES